MDRWFLCISQLSCTRQANGYSFTVVNCQRPGFTALIMTECQQLPFFQLCGCLEVIRAHVCSKWHHFPSTQHLDMPPPTHHPQPFFPFYAGYLADLLVLFCLMQGMACISRSSVLTQCGWIIWGVAVTHNKGLNRRTSVWLINIPSMRLGKQVFKESTQDLGPWFYSISDV